MTNERYYLKNHGVSLDNVLNLLSQRPIDTKWKHRYFRNILFGQITTETTDCYIDTNANNRKSWLLSTQINKKIGASSDLNISFYENTLVILPEDKDMENYKTSFEYSNPPFSINIVYTCPKLEKGGLFFICNNPLVGKIDRKKVFEKHWLLQNITKDSNTFPDLIDDLYPENKKTILKHLDLFNL